MNLKKIVTTAAILGAVTFSASTASAQSAYVADLTLIGSALTSADANSCLACHSGANNSAGDKGVTPFADDYKVGVAIFGSITAIEATALGALDSDGDGIDNATEAAAGSDFWGTVATTTASSSSSGGCITSSVTTPLMMVLAMLSLGFFVRRKKD